MKQYIPPGGVDRVPAFDPRTGEHLWILIAAYRVDPEEVFDGEGSTHLDHENLVHLGAVGCFHCEKPYERRLLTRRCPGDPK